MSRPRLGSGRGALARVVPARLAVLALAVVGGVVALARGAAAQCDPLPGNAFAFLPVDPPSDSCRTNPIVRWPSANVVYDCSFFADGQHGVSCNQSAQGCVDLCEAAIATWNADLASHFQFVRTDASTPVTFCTSGGDAVDGRTSVGGSDRICDGSAFGKNVIAVTLRQTRFGGSHEGELLDSDVTANNNFPFSSALFRATIAHELGHVLGLDHPDQCGRDALVLMRSVFTLPSTDPCFVSQPTADDLTGALTIYAEAFPTPTPTPICGDADGNGTVTVTDGVQTLRAAASLSSGCTTARCDVDGSGEVTVSDGVSVLRRAAGLSAANACVF